MNRRLKVMRWGLVLVVMGVSQWAFAEASAEVKALQAEWATIKYTLEENKRAAAFEKLAARSAEVVEQESGASEAKVWRAIILSTLAGEKGGLGALSLVEQARDLLLEVEKVDATVLNGSVYTSLGSLYYQVPGWPIGFGDDDKAQEYLEKALKANPDGMDANYFYGDFMIEEGKYEEAIKALEKALEAPPRPGREVADKGRAEEIRAAIAKAKEKQGGSSW